MQIVQAVVIVLILILSDLVIHKNLHIDRQDGMKSRVFGLILLFSLYGAIDLTTSREGIFWYTASVLYVWPLLFLLGGIYLCEQGKEISKPKEVLCIFCFFIGATAHEQIAVFFIVYTFFAMALHWIEYKKTERIRLECLGASLLGGILEIVAPGNFVRLEKTAAGFLQEPLLDKIRGHLYRVVNINFRHESFLFITVITICCLLVVSARKIKTVMAVPVMVLTLLAYGNLALLWRRSDLDRSWSNGVLVWFLGVVVIALMYYVACKRWVSLSFMAGGVCTQVMLLVMPSIPFRSRTMFAFTLNIFIVEILLDIYRERSMSTMILILSACICLIGCGGYLDTTCGYAQNLEVNEMNHHNLKKAPEILGGQKVKGLFISIGCAMTDMVIKCPIRKGVSG